MEFYLPEYCVSVIVFDKRVGASCIPRAGSSANSFLSVNLSRGCGLNKVLYSREVL